MAFVLKKSSSKMFHEFERIRHMDTRDLQLASSVISKNTCSGLAPSPLTMVPAP